MISSKDAARYLSPVVVGQSVKVRTTEGLGIPSGYMGQTVTVAQIHNVGPQTIDDVLAGNSAEVGQTPFTPLSLTTDDGATIILARGQVSAVSSALGNG